jgi:autotransporter-associated beta strand protein
MKNRPIHALALTVTTLALGAIQSSAQMIWNGSAGTDMANASNYSGTGNRTWNGTQAGNLSLTATAGVNGTFNYLSGQTGTVTVNGGANTFINDNNSTFLVEAGAGAVTWSNLVFQQGTATTANRTFTFRNNSVNDLTFDSSVSFTRVGTVVSGNARNLTFDGTGVVRVEGSIANMGNFATLTKSNSGTLVLSGSNSYAGTTTVSAGTLLATKAAALPGYNASSKVTVANGATLALRAGAASGEWISAEIDSLLGATTAAFASGSNLGIRVTTENTFSYASDVGTTQAAKGLVKTGAGTLTLSASNSYTGNTAVELGTLTITQPYLANAASVSLGASAVLNLNFDESGGDVTDTVDTLFINGVQQPAGVFGATGSGATTVNNVNFAGAGTLTVTNGPAGGFSSWITGFGLAVADQDPGDDPDNDGISNLVEYAIAGQNPTVGNPIIGTFAANILSFTKRGDASGLTYSIVESTDLGITDDWTEVSGGGYVNNATTISYTLTPGTPAKNFARLKVVKVP